MSATLPGRPGSPSPGTVAVPARTSSPRGRPAARRTADPRATHRRYLLDQLYDAPTAERLAEDLAGLLAGGLRPRPTRPLDENDAWLIAYPDHVRDDSGSRTPLAALADLVDAHMSPAVSGVHTLPLHPSSPTAASPSWTTGSSTLAYGTAEDLRRLAAGGTWMADAVVNHLSAQGTWFRRCLDGDPRFEGFFRTLDAGTDTGRVTRPRTSPLRTEFSRADGRRVGVWTTFSADQVDLDYREPEVLLAMVRVLLDYVGPGRTRHPAGRRRRSPGRTRRPLVNLPRRPPPGAADAGVPGRGRPGRSPSSRRRTSPTGEHRLPRAGR